MAAREILKNMNLFVDGRGYAGQVTEYNAPDLALLIEDHRAGGMDGPVGLEMGMEGLETSFSLSAYDADVLALFGIAQGRTVACTARGALESYDGTVKAVVHAMRGKITRMARGTWTPGTLPALQVTMRLDYYRETHDGRELHEIDLINMVRVIDGVDQLAEQRAALGI